MVAFQSYKDPDTLPETSAARLGRLLGYNGSKGFDDVSLAREVAGGFRPSAADALAKLLGKNSVIGPIISESTLERARKQKKLSRDMSERLYEVSRVVDAVSRTYRGDEAAIGRFLHKPHALLGGETPLRMAQSSSAGADAVVNLLKRAEYGFAV